jgi:hypothetical protein
MSTAEREAVDMGPISAEIALPSPGARPRAEDAWASARRLVDLLDRLAADADDSERYTFRLAQALAGNLTDELEAVVQRGVPKAPEVQARPFGRRRDRTVLSLDARGARADRREAPQQIRPEAEGSHRGVLAVASVK